MATFCCVAQKAASPAQERTKKNKVFTPQLWNKRKKRMYSFLNYEMNKEKRMHSFLNYETNKEKQMHSFLNYRCFDIASMDVEGVLFYCQQYGCPGCIPFYHQQYGYAGYIPFHLQ